MQSNSWPPLQGYKKRLEVWVFFFYLMTIIGLWLRYIIMPLISLKKCYALDVSCLGFEEKLEAHLRNFSCGANNATGCFSLFNQCRAHTFRYVSIVNCEGGLGLPWPPLEFVRTAQKNGNFILLLMKLYTDTMQGTSQDKPFLLSQDWLYVSLQVIFAYSTRGRDGLWQKNGIF